MIVELVSASDEAQGSVTVDTEVVWSQGMNDEGRRTDTLSRVRLRDVSDGDLLRALRAAARGDFSNGEIQIAIESACAAARAQGIAAEQLLIVLKEYWRELPEARRLLGRDAYEMRARLVTMCIDAYYAPDGRK